MTKYLFRAIAAIRSRRRGCPFRAILLPCPKTLPAPLGLPVNIYAIDVHYLVQLLCGNYMQL